MRNLNFDVINRERSVDPFFFWAQDQIFLNASNKNLFVMDGAIGTGKTSEFTIRGAYNIACSVRPINIGGRMVRESKWAMIRQSENSAYNTLLSFLTEAIFSPSIVASNPELIKTEGSHPKSVHVRHEMSDGTLLHMWCECHGFDNAQAENRLKTHEFLGAMIPEAQGIPFNIIETAIERCGRWRADELFIDRIVGKEKIILTGVQKLSIVLADINIPERPHAFYEKWYDLPPEKKLKSTFIFMTPPEPIKPIPLERATKEILKIKEYPITVYEGKEVVWVPNPKAYSFTKHFEEKDANGKHIKWSGYKYWLNKVIDYDESRITRFVMGRHMMKSGKSAVYKFIQSDDNVSRIAVDTGRPFYVGFDPGGHAGIIILQRLEGDKLNFIKEFVFGKDDNISTREQLKIMFDYLITNHPHSEVYIVPDPAAVWLQKSKMADSTESVLNILRMMVAERNRDINVTNTFTIEAPKVINQETDIRMSSLRWFIDQRKINIDPDGCPIFLSGLLGDYKWKSTKQGIILDTIDKESESCDVVEAAQYPTINILSAINAKAKKKNTRTPRQGALAR